MFREKKINNISVKPVVSHNEYTAQNTKGFNLLGQPIYTLYICAKKKSGKTSVINTLIQKTISKKTIVWIFCSTYRIDDTWKEIIRYLENKGNIVNCFDSIVDDKVNILQEIVDGLSQEDEEPEPEPMPETKIAIKVNFGEKESKKREYRPKKQCCENLFIFDDISQQLRNPAVASLLKVHRHTKSSVIMSSQYEKDISPASILQLDYLFCFRSFSREKMEALHKLLDLSIPFEQFFEIYHHCTKQPYSFMWFGIRTEQIRCGFNMKIDYDKIEY
jgi:hypothetical protein